MIQPRLIVMTLLLIGLGWPAAADELRLKDGRVFQGVVAEDADNPEAPVTIDAMVSGIRATLAFPRDQVDQIARDPVPEGFFDAPEAISLPPEAMLSGDPYMVIPIEGNIGREVDPLAVRAALDHAVQRGIGHVVFTVNSNGGDPEATRELARVLEDYDDALQYHAIVTKAEGLALTLPVWADTLHMIPGSTLGGLNLDDLDLPNIDAGVVAARAAAVAQSKGRDGYPVMAMILPEERIAAWEDDDGTMVVTDGVPEDVPADRVVFEDLPNTRLVLSAKDAAAIGFAEPFSGSPQDLGRALGLSDWNAASDYGNQVMQRAAHLSEQQERREEALAIKRENDIANNLRRHDELISYVLSNIREYEQVRPSEGQYATYITRDRFRNNRTGRYRYVIARDTNRFTKDSRNEWRYRTDRAINALQRVRRGLSSLNRLDTQARTLGIVRDTNTLLSEALTDAEGRAVRVTVNQLSSWAQREINSLRAGRNRTGN